MQPSSPACDRTHQSSPNTPERSCHSHHVPNITSSHLIRITYHLPTTSTQASNSNRLYCMSIVIIYCLTINLLYLLFFLLTILPSFYSCVVSTKTASSTVLRTILYAVCRFVQCGYSTTNSKSERTTGSFDLFRVGGNPLQNFFCTFAETINYYGKSQPETSAAEESELGKPQDKRQHQQTIKV